MDHIPLTQCSIKLRRRPAPSPRQAFSLIELLVTITVIALLIAVLLPALRGAIGIARSTVCLVNLGSIGKTHAIWSDTRDDAWLNLFIDDMNAEAVSYAADNNSFYYPGYGMQADIWLLGLADHEESEDGYVIGDLPFEAYSCPVVYRDAIGLPGSDDDDQRPHLYPLSSYYYSPTLFTASSLWRRSVEPVIAADIRQSDRRLVRTSDVRYTSSKVSMAERADFHADTIMSAADPANIALNALYTDGHARRTDIDDTIEPISTAGFGFEQMFRAMIGTPDSPLRIPFRSTPDGHLGRDVSR